MPTRPTRLTPDKAFAKAIELAGSEAALARETGFTQPAINKAKKTGRISSDLAKAVHAFSKGQVAGSDLRPDLWAKPEHVVLTERA
jgi:DNA-binding transcriptional regulator YdaS (Cro superfamily)